MTDAQLVQGHLQLALYLVVMSLQFLKHKIIQYVMDNTLSVNKRKNRHYGQSEGLFLNGFLQIDVVLVGYIQGQFEFSDLDLKLLLHTLNLSLQLRLCFHHAGIQLLDFDAGLFAN